LLFFFWFCSILPGLPSLFHLSALFPSPFRLFSSISFLFPSHRLREECPRAFPELLIGPFPVLFFRSFVRSSFLHPFFLLPPPPPLPRIEISGAPLFSFFGEALLNILPWAFSRFPFFLLPPSRIQLLDVIALLSLLCSDTMAKPPPSTFAW